MAGGLKRGIGLMAAVNIIISVMIGSGIFVSPTAALRYSGSIGFCLIVWTACGIISLLGKWTHLAYVTRLVSIGYINYILITSGALCFAELGTVIPRSGAEYAYLFETFSKQHKLWGPLPAFLCAWVYVVILRPAEIAVIVLTFAEYSMQPLAPLIGMDRLDADGQAKVVKCIALLGLGKATLKTVQQSQKNCKHYTSP